MLLKLPAGRAEGMAANPHMRLQGRAAALPEIAGRAGGRDIVPGGASALGTRQDMVEGQLLRVSAILAGEAVAQEEVEPRESRIFGRAHILPQRDDARQVHLHARAVDLALISGDDVDPFQKDRLDGGLPGPQAQGIITERRIIGVQHQGGTALGMPQEVGMVQGQQAPVFAEEPSEKRRPPKPVAPRTRGKQRLGRSLLSRHALARMRDALMTP